MRQLTKGRTMKSYRLIAILAAVLFAAPAAAQVSPADTATLDAHNRERQNYPGVNPLRWSPELAGFAQEWANEAARQNRLQHRSDLTNNPLAPGKYVGENIFWGLGRAYQGADAVRDWISEKAFYNHAQDTGLACYNIPPSPPAPGCSPPADQSCGHFCQVIWSKTEFVGCGTKTAADGGVYIVCNYYPAGNFANQKPY
jgi:pathogenesis-related protein 1